MRLGRVVEADGQSQSLTLVPHPNPATHPLAWQWAAARAVKAAEAAAGGDEGDEGDEEEEEEQGGATCLCGCEAEKGICELRFNGWSVPRRE